jgi:hypothetical protein
MAVSKKHLMHTVEKTILKPQTFSILHLLSLGISSIIFALCLSVTNPVERKPEHTPIYFYWHLSCHICYLNFIVRLKVSCWVSA